MLSELLDANPGLADAHYLLGSLHAEAGDDRSALKEFARASALAPQNAPGMAIDQGWAHLRLGEAAGARDAASRALASMPVEAHALLARIALLEGRLEEAQSEADKAAAGELVPRADTLLLQADLRLRREDPAGALQFLAPLSNVGVPMAWN